MEYNKMKIGIICSFDKEAAPYLDNMENVSVSHKAKLAFYEGVFDVHEAVVVFSGISKVNAAIAAQVLIDCYNVENIIVSGTAASLDGSLNVGDTVIATEIGYHDVEPGVLTNYHPWMDEICFKADEYLLNKLKEVTADNDFYQKIYFGGIVSGDAFINESYQIEIFERINPLCADAETAAIAHVCYANNVPFAAVRSISHTEKLDWEVVYESFSGRASLNSYIVVREMISIISKPH